MMQTVLITGGTGMIGKELCRFLQEEGLQVIILTRRKQNSGEIDGVLYKNWNPENNKMDVEALSQADHIIHLAGENIGHGRWTAEKRKKIMNSRVRGTQFLAEQLDRISHKPETIISASAIGYYRSGGDKLLNETDAPSSDFLGEVCKVWEAEAQRLLKLGKRGVILRTGMVLSSQDGILPFLVRPLKWGIALIPGNGQQSVSWIHLGDLVRLYATAMVNKNYSGIYNAVSPFPVMYHQFMTRLAQQLKGNNYLSFHIPLYLLKLFMREKGSALIKSDKVSAEKILRAGFEFSFPTIENALENIYGKRNINK